MVTDGMGVLAEPGRPASIAAAIDAAIDATAAGTTRRSQRGARPVRRRADRQRLRGDLRRGDRTEATVTRLSEAARAHVDALTRAWLGLSPDRDVPGCRTARAPAAPQLEEYEHSHRDQWGNWEFGFCKASAKAGSGSRTSIVGCSTDGASSATAPSRSGPDGRPFAICLSHDVDLIADAVTPRQAFRSMRLSVLGESSSSRDPSSVPHGPQCALRGLSPTAFRAPPSPSARALRRARAADTASLRLTSSPRIRGEGHRYDCTYDFGDACRFGGDALSVADVIRTLHEEGFEVGLHGSYNSALVAGRLAEERRCSKSDRDHRDLDAPALSPLGRANDAARCSRTRASPPIRRSASIATSVFGQASPCPSAVRVERDAPLDLVELPLPCTTAHYCARTPSSSASS